MNHLILTFDDLKQITGYDRKTDVERCLKDQGVRVFFGKTGPWTTVRALHAAQGLMSNGGTTQLEQIEF